MTQSEHIDWHDHTRVPYALYTDRAIYERELTRIFYGPFWHPVALEAEQKPRDKEKVEYEGQKRETTTD